VKRIAAFIVLASVSLVSQTPAPKSSVPTISDAHRATYFKAQLQMNQAQQQIQTAQAAMQAAVADLSKDCGEEFIPQMGPQGDPVCVPKPEPTKPAEKK